MRFVQFSSVMLWILRRGVTGWDQRLHETRIREWSSFERAAIIAVVGFASREPRTAGPRNALTGSLRGAAVLSPFGGPAMPSPLLFQRKTTPTRNPSITEGLATGRN